MKKRAALILAYIFLPATVVLTGCKSSSVNDDPPAGRSPGQISLSILMFENRAGAESEHWQYGLEGSMNAAMRQIKAIRLRGGTGYARRELGIEKGAALNAEQARNIGEIVEAQRIIWGSYQDSGNSWRVTAFLLNVASGEVSEPITAVGTDWYDLRDTLVQQILEQLRINPSQDEKEKMRRRVTRSPQAYEWYTRTFAHQSKGSPLSVLEESVRQAIKADPDFAEAYATLATIHANQGALKEAETDAHRALEIKPDLAMAHNILGAIYLLTGQNEEALRELQEALRIKPDDIDTLGRLSDYYLTKGEWDKAMSYVEKAIALAPQNANLHAQLGWVCVQKHDRDWAMRELKAAERLVNPDSTSELNTLQRLGQSYRYLGEIPLAVEYYEKLMALVRKEGTNPEWYAPFDKTLQHMKASLTPTFVEARVPRTYTERALQKVLQENLTPVELDMVVNPIAGSPEISRWARELTVGTTNDIDKARVIFDELIQRIQMEGGHGKRTAREVFAAWEDPDQVFCCQEFAKLYLALAREVGIKAFYVHLGRDYRGKLVFHDCAIIFVEGKALLVDPSYRWFGVPHQEFTVLDDVQTVAHQLFQHGSGTRSVARSRAGVKLHPDFAWGLLGLASALVNNDQQQEAINVLGHAERLEPGRWDAHQLRGVIAAKDEDWDAAMVHFNKALELNPEDAKTHQLQGMTLLVQGKEEEAREAFRACLRNGPRDREADEARRAIVQINESIGVESGEEFGTAALMIAIGQGKIESVRQMLAEGMDVNTQESSGATTLMIAAKHGRLNITKLLLSNGADANQKDKIRDFTALMVASLEGYPDITGLLLSAGANVNAARKTGETALHTAADPGHVQVVKLLLKAGANVNASNSVGSTPLLLASQNGHTTTVGELLAGGAYVDAVEKTTGATPLFLAAQNGHTDVVKLLLANMAEVDAALKYNGFTPLTIAVAKNHADMVKPLLDAGADKNTKGLTLEGEMLTPLEIAQKLGHEKMVELLQSEQRKR